MPPLSQIIITLQQDGQIQVGWTQCNYVTFYGLLEAAKVSYQDSLKKQPTQQATPPAQEGPG